MDIRAASHSAESEIGNMELLGKELMLAENT
jgi:hypothetical protein